MTDEVVNKFKRQISSWTLIPSDKGRFEIVVDGDLVFSKLEQGRFPENAEAIALIEKKLSPA